jgi:hypothetical protein
MNNHFHLLVKLRDPPEVSALMAGLLRAYVHHCHRRHGFLGHRWQGRFKSPAIQCRDYLLSCGRYIERNPLEAGAVAEPWDYPWSTRILLDIEQGGTKADDLLRPLVYDELRCWPPRSWTTRSPARRPRRRSCSIRLNS